MPDLSWPGAARCCLLVAPHCFLLLFVACSFLALLYLLLSLPTAGSTCQHLPVSLLSMRYVFATWL